jgi:hypothetical protein
VKAIFVLPAMAAIGYYIALPFIYAIAWLPFPLLYLLSDLLYLLVFRVIGYRREVVLTNLRNSFPGKSEAEIKAIADGFYRWFCDLVLETLKTLTMSPRSVRERVTFEGAEILRAYAERGQSVILVLGHYGNWELAGARYSQEKDIPQLYVIYHPLENPYFDRLLYRMRTRHGTKLYTMRETSRSMIRDRHLLTATAFIADQTPSPERVLDHLPGAGHPRVPGHRNAGPEAGPPHRIHQHHTPTSRPLPHDGRAPRGRPDDHDRGRDHRGPHQTIGAGYPQLSRPLVVDTPPLEAQAAPT